MPNLLMFDDGRGILSPLADLRASFDVRTGALTTFHRAAALYGLRPSALLVPPAIAGITSQAHTDITINGSPIDEPSLLINGRCPALDPGWMGLAIGEGVLDPESGDLVAACVAGSDAPRVAAGDLTGLSTSALASPALISRPWHVRRFREPSIRIDLELLTRDWKPRTLPGVIAWGPHPVSIHGSARVAPTVVIEAEAGPVVIDEDAVVRPGSILIGPAYIGPHSTVIERTTIKPFTAIGPHCKIAGEVGGTIFQGYANKAHDGHLGDSWIGEWVNIGAGTTNSNLLNTYDQVICRATPGGPNERTGEQFLGAIVGDHVKFAIGSRIMTGSILNTGCMFAQSTPISGCVPAFTWATDSGTRAYRIDKFIDVARTVMARRGVSPSDAYLERIRQVHAAATT